MESDRWDVVVCGVAVNTATGAVRTVRMGWRAEELGAWFLESGGRVLRDEGVPSEHLTRYTRLIFDDPGGGGEAVAPPPPVVVDPVSFDGRPRNKMRDRLARRRWEQEMESLAAD